MIIVIRRARKLLAALLVLALAAAAGMLVAAKAFPTRYSELVQKYAAQNALDVSLVFALIKAESGFAPAARSSKGANGLMQVTQETADWCVQKMPSPPNRNIDLLDPETNISIGCWYLSYLLKNFGDMKLALSAYNAGPGNVNKWLGDERFSDDGKSLKAIPFPETDTYYSKIVFYEQVYRVLGAVREWAEPKELISH